MPNLNSTLTAEFTARGLAISPMLATNMVAFLGDSRTEVGSVPTAYTTSPSVSKSARGLQHWLESGTLGRVSCPNALNFGVGGQSSTDILARAPAAVAAAKAAGAAVMVLFGITTNDRTSTSPVISLATSIANCAAVEKLVTDAGMIAVWVAETPRGLAADTSKALTGAKLTEHILLEQWQASRRGRPGVFVVRPWAILADTSTAANALAGYIQQQFSYDGLHMSARGAHRIVARLLLTLFNMLFATFQTRTQLDITPYSADNLNGAINLNPFVSGTAGTKGTNVTGDVADGWTAQCNAASGGTVAAVASIVNGRQRFVFSGTAGAGYDTFRFRQNINVGTRGVAVGKSFKGALAYRLTAGQTGLAGIAFYGAGNNIDFVAAGQATQSSGDSSTVANTPDFFPNDEIVGMSIGEAAALPAGSTDIAVGSRIIFRQAEATNPTPVSVTIEFEQVVGLAA